MQKEKVSESRSEKKAKKFRLYKFIALTLLVVFLLGGFVLFENDITMENLRYLIKYLDFSSSGAFSEEGTIYYNDDAENRFYVFRGDLAIANQSGVTLYDRRGSAVMTDSFTMSNPTCVCGDKYLVVYDLGGYQLRVYNSFALLYEKTFDYVIQSVGLNSDGDFCVVTSEKSYHSAVFVYDQNFNQIQQWFSSEKFAVDARLSDRDVLTISAVRAENGTLISELIELKIGKDEALSSFTVQEEMPFSHSTDRKGTLLLTDSKLRYIEGGAEVASAVFPDDSLKMIRYGDEICAVVQDELSVGVSYRVRVFDRKANELLSRQFSVQIRDVEVLDETVYVLTYTGLVIMENGKEAVEIPLTGEYTDLGVLSPNCVILCSDTVADIRIFD